ncbi:MAG TPA: hypothetical protein VE871_13540 [Longimicrobium sp.]|nr:hypothetical protein [Longimicrobium sp.]
MSADEPGEPQFSYRTTKSGMVFVDFHGRAVTTLRGRAAERFLARIAGMDDAAAQVEMARVTGNFKHGNERRAAAAEDGKD